MSEFYPEPEVTVEQELALLKVRIAIYIAQNETLRKEIDVLKEKNTAFATHVRQLEIEVGKMRPCR